MYYKTFDNNDDEKYFLQCQAFSDFYSTLVARCATLVDII